VDPGRIVRPDRLVDRATERSGAIAPVLEKIALLLEERIGHREEGGEVA
jgi:hypothetical protein